MFAVFITFLIRYPDLATLIIFVLVIKLKNTSDQVSQWNKFQLSLSDVLRLGAWNAYSGFIFCSVLIPSTTMNNAN
jgi:hypothetical protein